jgi:hypothetical protein
MYYDRERRNICICLFINGFLKHSVGTDCFCFLFVNQNTYICLWIHPTAILWPNICTRNIARKSILVINIYETLFTYRK